MYCMLYGSTCFFFHYFSFFSVVTNKFVYNKRPTAALQKRTRSKSFHFYVKQLTRSIIHISLQYFFFRSLYVCFFFIFVLCWVLYVCNPLEIGKILSKHCHVNSEEHEKKMKKRELFRFKIIKKNRDKSANK